MPALSRSQLAGYAVLAVLCLALGGRWLARRSSAADAGAPASHRAPAAAERVKVGEAAGRPALVHVEGAVRRPGVYRVPAGGRIQDAIRCAGGATRRANLAAINLAAPVQDGVQIVVPGAAAGGQAGVATPAPGVGAAAGAPVNLNAATQEQLETLDGVGPAIAGKIIEYRKQHGGFRSVQDLDQVSGIGPKRLAALKGKVTT